MESASRLPTTNLINALAAKHKIELHETPVGFKYIGELIKQDRILIGGEESAGLSIRKTRSGERRRSRRAALLRDGSLGGALRWANKLANLFAEVGSFYPVRENFRLTPEVKQKFTEKLRRDPSEFHGIKVAKVVRTDGLKLVLCRRIVGLLPALGHGAGGARL